MHHPHVSPARPTTRRRRAFNLIEMLVALAITAALLTATMIALDASFRAYQATTEVASTHTIARLAMNRMLTLIRTGTEFGPMPANPLDTLVVSESIEFRATSGNIMSLEWNEAEERLELAIFEEIDGVMTETMRQVLLDGVIAQYDEGGQKVMPFALEYELGTKLYRATIDLAVQPGDNLSTGIDGNSNQIIRLVASAMPRTHEY